MNSPQIGDPPGYLQRILVIDDDHTLVEMVRDKLDLAGYEVSTANSGQEGLDMIKRYGLPHLAIVDIMMPGDIDGFGFCQQVQQFSDLPIILLTAVDEEDTVIQGLERYAEDYVTKPFSPRELIARVQRVLRRIGDFGYTLAPVVQIDERLAVDIAHQEAKVNDQPVPLTPIETKILYLLIRNAGRITTTNFLLSRLWPFEESSEQTLRVHVHRLRHKIELNPSKPQYVVTERGEGYTFPVYK